MLFYNFDNYQRCCGLSPGTVCDALRFALGTLASRTRGFIGVYGTDLTAAAVHVVRFGRLRSGSVCEQTSSRSVSPGTVCDALRFALGALASRTRGFIGVHGTDLTAAAVHVVRLGRLRSGSVCVQTSSTVGPHCGTPTQKCLYRLV